MHNKFLGPHGTMEDDIHYVPPARDKGVEKDSRRLVYELEKKNAEIMREIARLRQNRATVQVCALVNADKC